MDVKTSSDHELDLPLSANISTVDISHFLLHLTCDLDQKTLSGDITVFCQPVKGGNQTHNSKDCNSLKHTGTKLNHEQSESSLRFTNVVQDKKTDQPVSSYSSEQMGRGVDTVNRLSDSDNMVNVSSQSYESSDYCNVKLHNEIQRVCNPDPSETSDATPCTQQQDEQKFDSGCVRDVHHADHPVITLDSHAIDVSCVEELVLLPEMERKLSSAGRRDIESKTGVYMHCYSQASTRPLAYSVSEHSLTIWRENLEKDKKLSQSKTNISVSGELGEIEDTKETLLHGKQRLDNCKNEVTQAHDSLNGLQCRGASTPISWDSQLHKGVVSAEAMAGSKGETQGEMDGETKGEIPKVVRIHYSTKSSGPSLKWTSDQDGRPCMFTIGHWLNNRSWFPSQDAPSAMPTWQVIVTVADHLTVLMSGDRASLPTSSHGHVAFYYYTTMPMPTSTLAIAVGSWKQIDVTPEIDGDHYTSSTLCNTHGSTCIVNYSPNPDLPCRVFSAECLMSAVKDELAVYIPKCLREVYSVLGHHPFQRLDVLIVPQCFDSLGMASPSLLLLSQSLLVGDSSMCARVAHEICHSWFGLLIGPHDWTEEWLTEGFCTYLEDILHARVHQWDEDEALNHLELRALLKKRTLVSEVENTEEGLQTLRPNQGEQLLPDSGSVQYVKNGMNPDKGFMQVHYLKGFFLLRHLQTKVGLTPFLDFLRQYVIHFHAQLITSQDFLDFFFRTFPHLKQEGLSESQLISEWLDCPGLPQEVKQFTPRSSNHLLNKVQLQVSQMQCYCARTTSKQRKKRLKTDTSLTLEMLHTDQLVLLLEDLLLLDHIPGHVLNLLLLTYQLSKANPEVRHRWCELIVKHHHKTCYKDVQHFLLHDQAMGVYLYGEMMLSGCKKLKDLAFKCFETTGQDMPQGAYKIVKSMLYGT